MNKTKFAKGEHPLANHTFSIGADLFKYLVFIIVDATAILFFWRLITDGLWFFAGIISIITIILNFAFLNRRWKPIRWLSPSLTLLLLMIFYPLIYTIYTAFTNYSNINLLTKEQAIKIIESEMYLPKDAEIYSWTAFRSASGDFMLWIESDGKRYTVGGDEAAREITEAELHTFDMDDAGIPKTIGEYARLSEAQSVKYLNELSTMVFGKSPMNIRIKSLKAAAQYEKKYEFLPEEDAIIDRETGELYYPKEGTFTSASGESVKPSFHTYVGTRNFTRLINSKALRGPIIQVFLWTFAFAFLAVLTTFALGLALTIFFHDPILPMVYKKVVRSIMLLPYTIPFFLSILIWRGMLNPHVGIINKILNGLIGYTPPWTADQWWAKAAVLIINLWLGFPYMFLITTGAMQSIPLEIYDAAVVDGATGWQKFWNITLPLLLISIGPLLVFSFAFNFNNFNVIYLFNSGGPPIPNSPSPVGHTDILISYSYRLAFEGGRGGDYSYAAAISIFIFFVLSIITIIQFRYVRIWEEISENE